MTACRCVNCNGDRCAHCFECSPAHHEIAIATGQDRAHEWAKHEAATLWCSILRIAGGSVQTRCCGRWAASEPYTTTERPKVAERCCACQESYAAHQLDELARTCGDSSRRHQVEVGLRELANHSGGAAADRRARRMTP